VLQVLQLKLQYYTFKTQQFSTYFYINWFIITKHYTTASKKRFRLDNIKNTTNSYVRKRNTK